MKKLLLLLLCVPLMFSCGGDKKSNDNEVEVLKNSQKYIDTASVIVSKIYNDKNFKNLDVGLLDTSIFQNKHDHSRPLRLILNSPYLVNRGSEEKPLFYYERELYNGYMFDFYYDGISENFLVVDGRVVVWESYDENGQLNSRLHLKDGSFLLDRSHLKKIHPPNVKKQEYEDEEIKEDPFETAIEEVKSEEKHKINKKALYSGKKKNQKKEDNY